MARAATTITLVGLLVPLAACTDDGPSNADASASASASAPSASPTAAASATPSAGPSPDASATPTTKPSDNPGPKPSDRPSQAAPTKIATPSPTPRDDGREQVEVPIDDGAVPAKDVTAFVSRIESVTGEAALPGEVGGPSLRVTVVVQNDTGKTLDTSTAVINLYYGKDRTPAVSLLEPGAVAFPAEVRDGRAAEAKAVFNVPVDQRDDIGIELDLGVGHTVVLFTGAAPS
ncbi:MAG: hypothetical protein AAGC49_05775 [Brevundimonas sp.]